VPETENVILGVAPGIIDWKLPNDFLDKIKNLKGISTLSAWVHYIDLDYCKKRNIVVTNTPAANSQSVAEYAIWMMFSLAKKLPLQVSDGFKTKTDQNHKQIEIVGKTMAVFGLGNIGSRIAKMGKGLGMNVIYWSPKTKSKDYQYKDFDDALREADFIFNCVETYEGTKDLFDQDKLSQMRKTAYFISVLGGMGWGPEDNDYLVKAVNEGKLAGFAVEAEHEAKYKVPAIKRGANIFIPGGYAYFTHEAEKLSLQKWVEAITGITKGNFKYRVI
ncbi:MAG: hypothetical protein GF390_03780, partial [Candidatus Pacebacteria bacterium]|nr:hypothetical protein [Candidatus Paceibacterota bacterium]